MIANDTRRYSVNADGVRMRAEPSTSATILVDNLGLDTVVTALSDQLITADGHDWCNVQSADGQAGWVACELLDPVQDQGAERYSVVADGVRMRAEPSTSATILVDNLGLGAIVTALSDQLITADGHDWCNVQSSDGQAGWVASELLTELPDDGHKDEYAHEQGSGGQSSGGDSQSGDIGGAAGVRARILATAATRKSIPYLMPPDPNGKSSLDCSLFVDLTFRDAGVPFGSEVRTAQQLREACDEIDSSEVQPGDLVFFQNTYPAGPGRASHVGIALGSGTHQMWDCHAFPGDSGPPGVGITNISVWWPDYWLCAGRPRQLKE
jgi:cell wall-associated NlpC family hydrolase